MDAKEYLRELGFDSSHINNIFNDDDKSFYNIEELMEQYAETKVMEYKESLEKELEKAWKYDQLNK